MAVWRWWARVEETLDWEPDDEPDDRPEGWIDLPPRSGTPDMVGFSWYLIVVSAAVFVVSLVLVLIGVTALRWLVLVSGAFCSSTILWVAFRVLRRTP